MPNLLTIIIFLIGLTIIVADLNVLVTGDGLQFSAITDQYEWLTSEYSLLCKAIGRGQWTLIARQMALIIEKGQNTADKYSNSDDRVRL